MRFRTVSGLFRIAKRILAKTKKDSSLRKLETLTSKDIFDEAKNGDEVAIEITEKYGYYLGKGLALKTNLAILRNQQIANILVETCPLLFSPTPNILDDIGRRCQSYIHSSSLCAHLF